ncbi:hypothetical protein NB696_000825 [Xanthomonas sacchari]|nr:RHS repeat protein [Xanthomonas sacchari]MCW0394724.1 hypothetical protein [Xanthomonas sacchari]MCW0443953.1 hypothetical protein [Xanthomonas sacchari]
MERRSGERACAAGTRFRRKRWRVAGLWGLLVGLLLCSLGALAATYVYDGAGRLVAVADDSGASARYSYDGIGNLLGVDRFAAGQLAIFTFSPARGAPGTTVRIKGQGFSATASQNTVKFNGTAATVSAASATELTVAVPSGATTGPISVAVGSAVAGSVAGFVVDSASLGPGISSVAPTLVAVGESVSVTGKAFLPVAGQTSMLLSGRTVVPSSMSNTKLVFAAPANVGSGKVMVTTPYGAATSTQDVVIAPVGVAKAEIESIKRLALGAAPQGVTVNAAEKSVAILYDVAAGDYPSLQFSALDSVSVAYTLYGPANALLASGSVEAGNATAHLPRAIASGTYLVLLRPSTAPASWKLAVEKAPTLGVDGATLAQALTGAGQSKRIIFAATAGQNLGFALSNLVTPNSEANARFDVLSADGSYVASQACYAATGICQANFSNLSAGIYSIVVSPTFNGDRTISFKSTLSSDLVATLASNVAKAFSLTRVGQNARLSFSGKLGQTWALRISGQTTGPAGREVYYSVYAPDGTYLTSAWVLTETTVNLTDLPADGTYVLFVDSPNGETVGANVLLSPGVVGAATPGGAVNSYATTVPGQNIYMKFTAEPGQNLGLGLSDLQTPGSTSYLYLNVFAANGDSIASAPCYAINDGCQVNLSNLAGGTYSVVVSPPSDGDRTMRFESTLSEDLTANLALDTVVPVRIARRGQNARLTFAAAAGQTLALRVAGQSTAPADRDVYYQVYAPDGTYLDSLMVRADGTINLPNLPLTGTYQVFVDSYYGETLNSNVLLSSGRTGSMSVGGAAGSYATTVPGQSVYLSFSASAGQNLGLGLSDLVMSDSASYLTVQVLAPDRSILTSQYCYATYGGCQVNLSNLAAGSYSVVVSPPRDGDRTMGFKALLSDDLVDSLVVGSNKVLNVARRGQNARLSFSGVAGRTLALRIFGQATTPSDRDVYYTVYAPDGSQLDSMAVQTDKTLNLSNLPATGTYLVFVDAAYGETLTSTLSLSAGVTGSAPVGGATGTYGTSVPGQNVYLSFAATEGQSLGLGLSSLVTPNTTSPVYVSVLGSDGTTIAAQYCYAYNDGCQLNLPDLRAGSYRVVVTPPSDGDQRMSFKSTLSVDLAATLDRDAAKAIAVGRRGQNARLSFSGTADETVLLRVSGQSTVPADRDVYYQVYAPDGSLVSGMSVRTDATLNLPNLPQTGTYIVFVDAAYGETSASTVLLSSGVTGTVQPDGGGTGYATTVPGQNVYLNFSATSGQNLGLALSDLTTPGTASYAILQVIGQDGVTVTSQVCLASNDGCQVNLADLSAGRYTVLISPPADGDGTMRFKATLSTDLSDALTVGTAKSFSVTRRGQNARFSFGGTAGKAVALRVSGQTTTPADRDVYYQIYAPDGALLSSLSIRGDGTLNLPSLPATGSYRVFVDSNYGETVSGTLLLANGVTGTVSVGGTTGSYATTVPGQNVYLSFTASAGQNLGFALSSLVSSNSTSPLYLEVTGPDGAVVAAQYCYASYDGCQVNLSNLVAGSYRIAVYPPSDGDKTMGFKSTLSADLTGTLPANTTKGINLTRRGQNARLSFDGVAGQNLALQISSQTTGPADRDVFYQVYAPDGGYVTAILLRGQGTLPLQNLSATGTYTLFVDPYYGETASSRVLLGPGN